ncbi:MAG: class I SAM-dependent methyltransferase [Phycisphaerales bacterium]|nr:class I SAM-dependent methyltransferase [Phycisphaerales bacterium]
MTPGSLLLRVRLVRGDFLDPRPADEAQRAPLARAANIPIDELAERTHELCPRDQVLRVIGPRDVAQRAIARLAELERRAEYAGAAESLPSADSAIPAGSLRSTDSPRPMHTSTPAASPPSTDIPRSADADADADVYADVDAEADAEADARSAGPRDVQRSTDAIYRLWSPNAFLERVSAKLAPAAIGAIVPRPHDGRHPASDVCPASAVHSASDACPASAAHPASDVCPASAAHQASDVCPAQPPAALDLACGVGREAVYLASLGWRVLGVDVLPDALERAQRLADRCAAAIVPPAWRCADLTDAASLDGLGPFELITCFRYLSRPLLARIGERLAPGGSLLVETFTTEHRARHGRPRREGLVLEPGELRGLAAGLRVVEYDEGWRDGGAAHTARLWARR